VAVKPHESYRGMKGPRCDGVLRIVTNRLDLPAVLIAEMYRLRWLLPAEPWMAERKTTLQHRPPGAARPT